MPYHGEFEIEEIVKCLQRSHQQLIVYAYVEPGQRIRYGHARDDFLDIYGRIFYNRSYELWKNDEGGYIYAKDGNYFIHWYFSSPRRMEAVIEAYLSNFDIRSVNDDYFTVNDSVNTSLNESLPQRYQPFSNDLDNSMNF